jgi:hypothetical protein
MLQDNAERCNAAALQAARPWLLGKSLASEIDELRFEGEGRTCPCARPSEASRT